MYNTTRSEMDQIRWEWVEQRAREKIEIAGWLPLFFRKTGMLRYFTGIPGGTLILQDNQAKSGMVGRNVMSTEKAIFLLCCIIVHVRTDTLSSHGKGGHSHPTPTPADTPQLYPTHLGPPNVHMLPTPLQGILTSGSYTRAQLGSNK